MDPFLEPQLWADFHTEIIAGIRAALMPQLRPRYVARVEERVYVEEEPEVPMQWIRPDVTLHESGASEEAFAADSAGLPVVIEPVSVPIVMPETVHETFLEVRIPESQQVVTVIEVLSPANKRPNSSGREEYLAKRSSVFRSASHLIEIDLLRGGERLPMAKQVPPGDYFVIVSRSERRPIADVWAFSLRNHLPKIPVPLAGNDPDVWLDLQAVFAAAYDRAGYDYSINYRLAPAPPLTEADDTWIKSRLGSISAP